MSAAISRRLAEAAPYSYRADPAVPAFPDDKALVVFDGACVLCSGFAKFILKRDKAFAFRLTTAQSPLGQALYRHYGLDTQAFETNLVIADGRAYAKLGSVAAVGARLGRAMARARAPAPAAPISRRLALRSRGTEPICLVRARRQLHDPAAPVARTVPRVSGRTPWLQSPMCKPYCSMCSAPSSTGARASSMTWLHSAPRRA